MPLLEAIAGFPAFSLLPVFALLSAFAFSTMAMIADRLFLVHAVFFAGVAAVMAWLPDYRFILYGIAWFVVLEALGLYYRSLHAPKAGRRL